MELANVVQVPLVGEKDAYEGSPVLDQLRVAGLPVTTIFEVGKRLQVGAAPPPLELLVEELLVLEELLLNIPT